MRAPQWFFYRCPVQGYTEWPASETHRRGQAAHLRRFAAGNQRRAILHSHADDLSPMRSLTAKWRRPSFVKAECAIAHT